VEELKLRPVLISEGRSLASYEILGRWPDRKLGIGFMGLSGPISLVQAR
jgi:hypothetical protein